MKIYTRSGDTGQTGLFGGPRVSKDDDRIEAYGTVDELNAALGLVRVTLEPATRPAATAEGDRDAAWTQIDGLIRTVQHELFSIGAELATPDPDKHQLRVIGDSHIRHLEQAIDRFDAMVPPLTCFVLPAGTACAAHMHLARAICRRAERRIVTLGRRLASDGAGLAISADVVIYLNRLSDLLFVLSRVANHHGGAGDVPWEKPVVGRRGDASVAT